MRRRGNSDDMRGSRELEDEAKILAKADATSFSDNLPCQISKVSATTVHEGENVPRLLCMRARTNPVFAPVRLAFGLSAALLPLLCHRVTGE